VFDGFNGMTFGVFSFEDIKIIGWVEFFCWGEIIFNTLIGILWGRSGKVCEEFTAESGRDGIGFSKVKGEDFQDEGIEEIQDQKLDKAMIKASDIHGATPSRRG
jgi:hypothetical protein